MASEIWYSRASRSRAAWIAALSAGDWPGLVSMRTTAARSSRSMLGVIVARSIVTGIEAALRALAAAAAGVFQLLGAIVSFFPSPWALVTSTVTATESNVRLYLAFFSSWPPPAALGAGAQVTPISTFWSNVAFRSFIPSTFQVTSCLLVVNHVWENFPVDSAVTPPWTGGFCFGSACEGAAVASTPATNAAISPQCRILDIDLSPVGVRG